MKTVFICFWLIPGLHRSHSWGEVPLERTSSLDGFPALTVLCSLRYDQQRVKKTTKKTSTAKKKKNRRLHPANNSNYHGWFTQGAIFGAWQQQESWMRDVRRWWEKFCSLVVVAQLPARNMAAACRRIRVWEINMLIGIWRSGSARWVWLFMNRHAEAWCGNNVTPARSVKVVWMLRGAAGAVSGGIEPDRRSPQSHRGRNPNCRRALDSNHDLKNLNGTFAPLTWTSATSKATSFRRVKCNSTATSLIVDWVSVWLKSLQITSKSPKEKKKILPLLILNSKKHQKRG